jgi:hypothetical protein
MRTSCSLASLQGIYLTQVTPIYIVVSEIVFLGPTDERLVRRWRDRDRLLQQPVEQLAAAASGAG